MNNQGSSNIKGPVLLLLTAFIWGTAFVAQSVGTEYMGPFTFNMSRSLLAGLFLLPVIAVFRRAGGSRTKDSVSGQEAPESRGAQRKTLLTGGVSCGVILFISSNLQKIGIQYTTVGKAGFITALYIVLVPVFGVFLHKKAGIRLWLSVLVAIFGLYLLCMNTEHFSINHYDVILLLCAASFAVQILCVDHFSPKVDPVKLSCIQFLVCSLLSFLMMVLTEHPSMAAVMTAWQPILYAGILSCGVAYTLQVVAQTSLNPVIASLIMSLESVISAIAGWLVLGQHLSGREIAGCVVMFAAIILAQLPSKTAK